MRKTKTNQQGFTLIELLIVIAIIGILASVVLVSLNSARTKARVAKYITYVNQVSGLAEKAIALGSFESVPVGAGGCLGVYSGNCWSSNANLNTPDTNINNALQTIGAIPEGEYSPYTSSTSHAVAIYKAAANTVRIYAFIGTASDIGTCDKFGWVNVNKVPANGYCYVNMPL